MGEEGGVGVLGKGLVQLTDKHKQGQDRECVCVPINQGGAVTELGRHFRGRILWQCCVHNAV